MNERGREGADRDAWARNVASGTSGGASDDGRCGRVRARARVHGGPRLQLEAQVSVDFRRPALLLPKVGLGARRQPQPRLLEVGDLSPQRLGVVLGRLRTNGREEG